MTISKKHIRISSFVIIVLFLFNAGLGLFLTHFNLVKKWYIFPNLYVEWELKDVNNVSFSPDGPFVFFENDLCLIKNIVFLDSLYVVETDSMRNPQNIEIRFAENIHPGGIKAEVQSNFSNPEWEYELPGKIFVVSDIEGQFDALWQLLMEANVVDTAFNWTFGNNSLVINGDLVDRGPQVTECLWLVYKLWKQAPEFGGTVHYILGNHEIMLLQSDTRYVHEKYLANSRLLQLEYEDLFNKSSVWGRWFRTRNAVEKIGPYIFVHGGIPPVLKNYSISISEMNSFVFGILNNQNWEDSIRQNLKAKVFVQNRPYWFRDYAQGEVKQASCDSVLQYYGSKRMIVGHTVVDKIQWMNNEKVIAVDVDHAEGNIQGLLIENSNFYKIIPGRDKEALNTEKPV